MDGGGAIQFGRERELRGEDLALLVDRGHTQAGNARIVGLEAVDDPAIQPDLADAGPWIGEQLRSQGSQPIEVMLGYVYQLVYGPCTYLGGSCGGNAGANRAAQTVTLYQQYGVWVFAAVVDGAIHAG